MSLAQFIIANPAIAMLIGISITVLALTALEISENGLTKKTLENIMPVYQLYAASIVSTIVIFMPLMH